MIFIETPLFTQLVQELLPDENYRLLQQALVFRPEAGDIIQGGGGLRKIRWSAPGRGKRGGVRIIYYWDVPADVIYLLLPYPKNKQEDLTPVQLKTLRNLIKEWLE